MPRRRLLLNGGYVSARDPAMLAEGELSAADDSMYKPGDQAIWSTTGRTKFNSTAEGDVIRAGVWIGFGPSTTDDLLIAAVGTKYRKSPSGLSGTFSDLVTGLVGSNTLVAVHKDNVNFLFNGADRNRAVATGGVVSFHGMLRNTAAPTVDASGAGSITLTSGKALHYWVEERVKVGSEIVRRNAASLQTTVTVTGPITSKSIVVTRPAVRNSEATHWALYGTSAVGVFPIGAEIGEVAIGTTSITDTRTGTDPEFPGGDAYETVATVILGVTQTVPRNDEPPIASTADVYEGCLVTNDVANPSHVRFSFPDEPHAFPASNLINCDPSGQEAVIAIKVINDMLLVVMRDSIRRIDTMPHPGDASAQPERVKQKVFGAFGGVSPEAVVAYSYGDGEVLGVVTPYALIVTNGMNWDVVSADIDWAKDVGIGAHSDTLVNNPEMFRLEHRFVGPNGPKAFFYHYHPHHVKEGKRLKVTGPNRAPGSKAFVGRIESTGAAQIYCAGRFDGFLYNEGVSLGDASSAGGIQFRVSPKGLYPEDLGGEVKVIRTHIHHRAALNTEFNVATVMRAEGIDDVTVNDLGLSAERRQTTTSYKFAEGEEIIYTLSSTNPPAMLSFNQMMMEYESLDGKEQP